MRTARAAFSPFRLLIAVVSIDRNATISRRQLWNFEMARHEGCCQERHQHAITCLAFLDPFPILLSTDVGGCLALWALPPARVGLR